jgi:hypothetical protein
MSLSVQQRHMGTLQPGDLVVVIRALSFLNFWALANVERPDDFDARGSDELTLRKSDQIELLELDEGFGDGWYLGRLLDQGTTGLFPGGRCFHLDKRYL